MYLIELDVHSINETFCGSYIQICKTHMSNGKKAAISAISFRFYFKKMDSPMAQSACNLDSWQRILRLQFP